MTTRDRLPRRADVLPDEQLDTAERVLAALAAGDVVNAAALRAARPDVAVESSDLQVGT